mmetsp:Transcript_369/g.1230  ORF Transcript_369/g.1230 Transcript_369/m.1230 type:complete len:228 (+) Transcript_369:475-1158(+)
MPIGAAGAVEAELRAMLALQALEGHLLLGRRGEEQVLVGGAQEGEACLPGQGEDVAPVGLPDPLQQGTEQLVAARAALLPQGLAEPGDAVLRHLLRPVLRELVEQRPEGREARVVRAERPLGAAGPQEHGEVLLGEEDPHALLGHLPGADAQGHQEVPDLKAPALARELAGHRGAKHAGAVAAERAGTDGGLEERREHLGGVANHAVLVQARQALSEVGRQGQQQPV